MGGNVSFCGLRIDRGLTGVFFDGGGEQALVLQVVKTAVEESSGARPSGLKVGDELLVSKLDTPRGLEPLSFRYRQDVRSRWPDEHRFQASRRSWQVPVATSRWPQGQQVCVLQMASRLEERSQEFVEEDLEDANSAASYAHRFNLYHRQRAIEAGLSSEEALPIVKVAAPAACRVVKSTYPALIPVGSVCTLVVYPYNEVRKFVFDGSEDFLELPQAFFHHAAFSSGGKQLVCDIQGMEEDDGSLLIIDPCVLRPEMMTVADLVVGAVGPKGKGEQDAAGCLGPIGSQTPSAVEHFDALHPKCAQLCKAFDAQRKSVKSTLAA
ncbi:unnamed protein product [Polarella glacialis]|uniref:Alpha-type protein kinase domain-containing protein n=1 Tax=Polarella glacialis TaxID=89957 RepID=A0A813D4P8_POLGL|nr:unnamed protein product [Polarella glacialis]CAE8631929.1 unnamed protein product [Polarella glacialis]